MKRTVQEYIKYNYFTMLSWWMVLCLANGPRPCLSCVNLSISLLCNGWTPVGAIWPCNIRPDSNTLIWSNINPFNRLTCGTISGFCRANSGVRKASWYLVIPPITLASMIPCSRILNGLIFLCGSAVYCATNRLNSLSTLCIVSQAYCTGANNSDRFSITSNHLRIPGNLASVINVVLSIHNDLNSFSRSTGPRCSGRSNVNLRTSFTK